MSRVGKVYRDIKSNEVYCVICEGKGTDWALLEQTMYNYIHYVDSWFLDLYYEEVLCEDII